MDLGVSERVAPLVSAVRRMVREEIAPLDAEFHALVGATGDIINRRFDMNADDNLQA